jgi:hypothetical protein
MKVTLEHMLRCPNERMEAARSDAIQCVRTKGLAQDFTKPFMTCVTHYLKRALEELEGEYDQEVQRVFDSQDAIGPMMFVRGYISREWVSLGQSMAIQSIKQKLPKLVTLLYPIVWDEVVGQLWSKRNDILHRSTNYVMELTQTQMGDRLLWYLQHKDELSRRDQDLIRFTPAQINAMTITQ